MSEAENIEDFERPARWSSFAEEVWHTLSMIDISSYVESKGTGRTFDYLPWASAWSRVMDCFPESDFVFDEPKFYQNGTGEQWITVNIRRGDEVLSRRWWLPYLTHTNQPISDPNSFQINNTRMRVLVKCLAMCGLGTELYSGEDVPDESHDREATGTSARKAALAGAKIDPVAVDGYVSALTAMLPDSLVTLSPETGKTIKIHWEGLEDWAPLTDLSLKIMTLGELAIAVADGLPSWRRSFMRKAIERYREESKEADEQAAQE